MSKTAAERAAYQRAWRAANRDKCNVATRKWRAANFVVNGVRSNAATPESRKAKKAVTDTRYKKSAKGAATRRAQEHKAYWKDPKGNSEKRMKLYRENPERYAAYRTGVDPATLTKRPDLCEVCGEPPKFNVLHLDHDHKTKKFRGWLCHHCNTSLGQMKDSPATLRALADYLERKNVS